MKKTEKEIAAVLFETMVKIREFDLAVEKNFKLGHAYGTAHSAMGQEAVSAGCMLALEKTDVISTTHRGHGHSIAKGADMKLMMAEVFGKATGYCKGRGGSMHIADIPGGNLGANGIVADGVGIATGAALAAKKQKTGQIIVSFFGDGATNEGIWHESLNMASIWDLPIIYLCENNKYGQGMKVNNAVNIEKISDRAKAYNIDGITIDGQDARLVYDTITGIEDEVRKGKGPVLLECTTYRVRGHSIRDAQRYRPEGESKKWLSKFDPIELFKKYISKNGLMNDKEILGIEKKVLIEIEEAVDFALNSPLPDTATVMDDIYA